MTIKKKTNDVIYVAVGDKQFFRKEFNFKNITLYVIQTLNCFL